LFGRQARTQNRLGHGVEHRRRERFIPYECQITGEIGIHSAPIDEPEEDFFQLSPAADLRFILVAKDPGMEVWDDHGSGFMGVGDSFFVGEAPFDTHPVWNLLNSTPDAIYTLTLKLHDLNGVYPDSEPFTLNFTQFQPYRIFLSQTSPRQVTLSWPTNATDWALETASSMTSTNWAVVTNAPGISGANFALDFDTAAPQQFFRLHRQ
jgi:hypothetical protein